MISIIICSREKVINANLSENIKNTVGCDYELIVIDNSKNQYSVFEAYNLGIKQSKGVYLCFLHDDLIVKTNDWGVIIQKLFANDNWLGLIGIAGAKQKSRIPCGWWDCDDKYKVVNIIQHFKDKTIQRQQIGFEDSSFEEVVVIDGVFMCMRKSADVFFSNKLKGFHNYDLNISFEIIRKGFKIGVTNEILLEHFSIGSLNEEWLVSTIELHNRYSNLLPVKINDIVITESEIFIGKKFIDYCISIVGRKKMYKYCFDFLNIKLLLGTRLSLLKYLVKRIFEK